MREITRVEDTLDDEGYVIPGYTMWLCDCGEEVYRQRGESDVCCSDCGAWYNAGGQRLRDDWMNNPAWKYPESEISDLDGFEMQQLSQEQAD